ncbi:SRPBCC family protein [Aureibaculum conchae]|uniref:SRPBCC family protein n=1 Tax=Aureibaculum sp. 2308TA14-22 TaxID=3108392 RepID=UPI003392C494
MNTTKSNSDKSYGIYHDLTIKTPIEKVFEAVSEPEHLINWWPLKCQGIPEIGNECNFYFTSEYDWYGKVSKLIPNKSFHIEMTKSDSDWNSTTFGFDLKEKNDKTLLSFSHTGWQECNSHFRISSFCWAMLLNGLKDYLEKGIILPFEERS